MTHIDPFNPHPRYPEDHSPDDPRYDRSDHPSAKTLAIWAGLCVLAVLAVVLASHA